ncbi:MAG: PEP-CTERM sorting domain-containing protein [Planctomycetales bacterium]|nr:PEP-CTERM sorting domain-containing protein [Planctomycetales bacterium]
MSNFASIALTERSAKKVASTCLRRCLRSLFLLVLVGKAQSTFAYRVEFGRNATGEYRTVTQNGTAAYIAWYGGNRLEMYDFSTPATPDINVAPTTTTGPEHPLRAKSGRQGRLDVVAPLPHQVLEGKYHRNGAAIVEKGNGVLKLNMSGTFRIVPEDGDRQTGTVTALADISMHGILGVNPHELSSSGPSSGYSGSISIEGLGSMDVNSRSVVSSSTGNSAGVSGDVTLSYAPGLTIGGRVDREIAHSQVSGKNVNVTKTLRGRQLPINQDLSWSYSYLLTADNQSTDDYVSAAWAWLSEQYVNISIPKNLTKPRKDGSATAPVDQRHGYRSDATLQYDPLRGMLHLGHPTSLAGNVRTPMGANPDGSDASASEIVSFYDRPPQIHSIVADYVPLDDATDPMRSARLVYSPIYLVGEQADGTIRFEDATISYYDAAEPDYLIGAARLTDIIADPEAEAFTASIVDFEFGLLPEGISPLADKLAQYGGQLHLDPSILAATDFFSAAGESGPYTIWASVNVPNPDFDVSGVVDGFDFLEWQRGQGDASDLFALAGDANWDHRVDGADLQHWANEFGGAQTSVSAATRIPEPGTIALLAAASLFCSRRDRRK